MSDNSGAPRKSSFGQSMKAVFWSFFGVRKRRDLEADATQLNPLRVCRLAANGEIASTLRDLFQE